MTVIPDSAFGQRVRQRLHDEHVVWLTTVGSNGTPQPNPVWFLWEPDTESVLVYNAVKAARLAHIAVRPHVALNFDADANGGDVVVLTGTAERAVAVPAPDGHEAYLAKYGEGIAGIGSDPAKFARDYAEPVRITINRVRGF